MADDKSKVTDTSNASNATESPLLSILSSIGSSSNSSGGQEFDLSSILSNGSLSATTAATRSVGLSASATTTPHPIDSDIDQLMKSLSSGSSVDTGKVTNDDLDKILGSIGMNLSSGTPVAGLSTTSASNGDPLEALSRDFGIDLKPTAATLAPTMSATPLTPNALKKGNSSSDQLQLKSRVVSMSSMPNVSGTNSGTVTAQPIQDKQAKPASTPKTPSQQQKPTTTSAAAAAKSQTTPQKTLPVTHPSPVSGGGEGGSHQPSPHGTPRPSPPVQNSNTPRPQTPQPVRSRPSTPRSMAPAARTPTADGQQRPAGSPSGSNNPSRSGSPRPQGKQNIHSNQRPVARPVPRPAATTTTTTTSAASTPTTDPSKWLAATMSTLPSNQQERLSGLFRSLQAKTIPFQAFAKDAEAIMGPKFHELLALMRNQGPRHAHSALNTQQGQQQTVGRPSPRPNVQASNPMGAAGGVRPHQGMSSLQTPESNKNLAMMRQLLMQQHQQNSSSGSGEQLNNTPGLGDFSSLTQSLGMRQAGGNQQLPGNDFEAVVSRWRQVIVNPKISAEQLSVLSMQLHAYGEMIANANGPMASVPEEVRREQFGQISKLQALISQRQQSSRVGVPLELPSSAGVSTTDRKLRDPQRKDSIGSGKQIKPMKRSGSVTPRSGSPAPHMLAKRQKTGGDETGPDSDADMPSGSGSSSSYNMGHPEPYVDIDRPPLSHAFLMNRNPISRTSTTGTSNGDENDMRADIHRRSRGANPAVGGGGGNNDAFSLDDVMGYAGVDLREESEMIIGSSTPQSGGYPGRRRYGEPASGSSGDRYSGVPRITTRVINGVEVSYNRSLDNGFANAPVMEAMMARICKKMHLRAVAPDAIPYLVLALQERLRGFMELASAAAHHRSRTQTLPPPPLDPVTRHPLYKIKPHLDVKKQLAVLERADQLIEQRRQRVLSEREQCNSMDALPEGGGDANGGEGGSGDRANEGYANNAMAAAAGGDGAEPVKKRGRKREDSSASETASYTAKNMPDDVRNKISNETALRAAGGFRKSWMSSSSADWMMATSSGSSMTSRVGGARTASNTGVPLQQPHPLSVVGGAQTPSFANLPAGPGNVVPGQHPFQHNHHSSFGGASDFNADARVDSPAPGSTMSAQISSFGRPPSMVPQRSAAFTAPLMLTVRDCLFSLERERLGGVRVGRGGGDRVLIQAYMKYLHD